MEFWVLLLFIGVFSLWVQSRIRRQKEDERFANVIEALNRLEPRLNELKKLQSRGPKTYASIGAPEVWEATVTLTYESYRTARRHAKSLACVSENPTIRNDWGGIELIEGVRWGTSNVRAYTED